MINTRRAGAGHQAMEWGCWVTSNAVIPTVDHDPG